MDRQDLQNLGLSMAMMPMDNSDQDHITTLDVVPGELVTLPVGNLVHGSNSQALTMSSISLSNLVQVSETGNVMTPFTYTQVIPSEKESLDHKNVITFSNLETSSGNRIDHHHHKIEKESHITGIFEHYVAPSQLIVNKDFHFGADTTFWQCLSHPAYADINLTFEDGVLPVNRAVMAALSGVVAETIEDGHDAVVLPNLKMQHFFDFVLLFTENDSLDVIDNYNNIKVVVDLLDVKIFQSRNVYHDNIKNIAQKVKEVPNKPNPVQIEDDPFAPGYATKHQQPLNEPIKIEKTILSVDKTKDPDDPDYDSFIDDDEASDAEEFWGDDEYAPGKSKPKAQRKALSKDEEESNSQNCVELLLLKNENNSCQEVTLDVVVAPFLKCHDCHQVGYTSLTDLINHMRTTHQWQHHLNHCIYCDLPFMKKNKCIKHEMDGCKNTNNICYKCGENFAQKTDLLDHLLKDHNHGVKRRCPHCENDYLTMMPHAVNKWPHIDKCYTAKHEIKKTNPVGRPKGSKTGSWGKKICDDCGGTFRDSWKHKRQCTAINKDIKYICNECRKGFRRLGAVKKHFKLSNKCKLNSQNQIEYQKLMKYVENNIKGKTVCQDCGCEYVTRKGPQEHRKNCSTYTQFKCYACNRGMNAMDGFHIHFSKFPECRAAPENSEIVAEIVARSQKPEFHVCYLCGAQYKAKESIEKHMLTHSEHVEYFLCRQPECGKKFITQKALDMHLKNHTMPKVICSICGKQVKQGSMPLHMILHTGKKIECNLCGKMFQHKGVLNKHIRTIHDEKKPPRNQKDRKKKPKKTPVNNIRLIQNKDMSMIHHQGPIQTIQVQLDAGDGNQPQTVRVSLPPVSLGPELPQGVRVSLPEDLQTVTVVSQANGGIVGNQTLQGYQQNVLIPSVPGHMLNTNNIQQFLQMSGQTRYQS